MPMSSFVPKLRSLAAGAALLCLAPWVQAATIYEINIDSTDTDGVVYSLVGTIGVDTSAIFGLGVAWADFIDNTDIDLVFTYGTLVENRVITAFDANVPNHSVEISDSEVVIRSSAPAISRVNSPTVIPHGMLFDFNQRSGRVGLGITSNELFFRQTGLFTNPDTDPDFGDPNAVPALAGLTFTATGIPPTTPIPVPSSLLFLGSALGAGYILARRRGV